MTINPIILGCCAAILALCGEPKSYGFGSYTDGEELGILIVGSITNTNIEDNVALIKETTSGRVKAVKQYHNVLDNYVVEIVTPKYIMLEKNKKHFLVYQSKFAGDFVKTNQKPTPSSLGSGFGSFSEQGFEREGNSIKVSSEYVDKLISQDLSKILMQATAIPHMENGVIDGFTLLQIDSGSIFDKMGFKDFDIIKAINGRELNSIAGAVALLRSLKGETEIGLEINRSGTEQKLQLNVL